jgi:hypothetical protein
MQFSTPAVLILCNLAMATAYPMVATQAKSEMDKRAVCSFAEAGQGYADCGKRSVDTQLVAA